MSEKKKSPEGKRREPTKQSSADPSRQIDVAELVKKKDGNLGFLVKNTLPAPRNPHRDKDPDSETDGKRMT